MPYHARSGTLLIASRGVPKAARRRPGRPPAFLASECEPILPAQWAAMRGHDPGLQPEKRLMLAILSDAIELALGERSATGSPRAALVARAVCWIGSDDRRWPFSFVNICDVLGFQPERVRRGIARLVRHCEGPQASDVPAPTYRES